MSEVKERPILFSAPMVRAILEGRKTQTRRVVKWPVLGPSDGRKRRVFTEDRIEKEHVALLGACPFSVRRLWVRETWGLVRPGDPTDWYRDSMSRWPVHLLRASWDVEYRASWGTHEEACLWRPSIFMPRWASRITLEVTGVRVERLQDISEEDALAEGLGKDAWSAKAPGWVEQAWDDRGEVNLRHDTPRDWFRALWSSINGAESWDANPWVWVVSFTRVGAMAEVA